MTATVHTGDCLAIMPTLEAESVDAIVTDPPYGLSFMGREWDRGVPGVPFWVEALRVAKPGAHLVAFGGTRTFHRLVCAIEDAGWEVRDTLAWLYGSGFPKSLDVSKAIDREAGAERDVLLTIPDRWAGKGSVLCRSNQAPSEAVSITSPATPEAAAWSGWGTALKPAWEPICLARKPLARGATVARNVLACGCGALNIDACRVGSDGGTRAVNRTRQADGSAPPMVGCSGRRNDIEALAAGRWPANLLHDGSPEVVALFPSEAGGAARFFYSPKASVHDREYGTEGLPLRGAKSAMNSANGSGERRDGAPSPVRRNHHPTVKPTDLMRWLCRLVTPPGGLILDPFTGSGSTGVSAVIEGFHFVGIELDEDFATLARTRIDGALGPLFRGLGGEE